MKTKRCIGKADDGEKEEPCQEKRGAGGEELMRENFSEKSCRQREECRVETQESKRERENG